MKRFLLFVLFALMSLPVIAQEYGANWTLTWYDSTDLSGDVVATTSTDRLDIDFTEMDLPDGIDDDNFSVKAESQFNFSTGTYRFRLASDDGARVFIGGVSVIDAFFPREYDEYSDTADVYITDGSRTLRVEYFQQGGGAKLRMNWEKISDERVSTEPTAIPSTPQPTAIPLPAGQVATGQVLNVKGLSIRTGPYLGASRVDIIEPGTEYPVFARNVSEGEFTWYLIQVQDFIDVLDDTTGETIIQPVGDVKIGWASGRYFMVDTADVFIPFQGSVFETLNFPASTGVEGVLRSNMRLRQGPSYRTPTLEILDWGASVEIVGWTKQANEPHWYQVIYEGQVGWLFAPFIAVDGNLRSVPQY